MITVAREDEKTLRVNVIPKRVKEDENPALSTPLSYTGTPEELDAELGKHLASYVECHAQLGSTLAQAKAEMEAAAKAATADSNPAAPAQAADGAAGSNTLFGGPTPAEPVGATKPTGGESTCKLAL
jgi:PRTRC genetic system protein E